MTDIQRLRDLADTLEACEWNHGLGSAQLCRDAAEELEWLRAHVELLKSCLRPLVDAGCVEMSRKRPWEVMKMSVVCAHVRAASAALEE